MQNVNLDEHRIKVEGSWLSSDDLKQKIEEKMKSGDMKIAELAEALERLSLAIENSKTLEMKLALPKDVYNELKALGKGDDKECVRKAIMAFIDKDEKDGPAEKNAPLQHDPIELTHIEIEEITEPASEPAAPQPGVQPVAPSMAAPTPPPLPDPPEYSQRAKQVEVNARATVIKCIKCKSPIEITAGTNPDEIRCPHCSALGRLKLNPDNSTSRARDHFVM